MIFQDVSCTQLGLWYENIILFCCLEKLGSDPLVALTMEKIPLSVRVTASYFELLNRVSK